MWVLTTKGFVSIIQRPEDKAEGLLTVRGRVRSDLEALAQSIGLDEPDITESSYTDYRYRMVMTRAAVEQLVTEAVRAIDYPNFKSAVSERQGLVRAEIYSHVWEDLYALNVNRLTSTAEAATEGDDE